MLKSQHNYTSIFAQESNTLIWNYFTIPSDLKQNVPTYKVLLQKQHTMESRTVSLVNSKLLQYKNNKIKWVDVKDAQMERLNSIKYGVGIQLIKNNQEIILYGDVEELASQLKQFTVQHNLNKHYVLIKRIGRSRHTDVYIGENKQNHNQVAIKCFHKLLQHESILVEIQTIRQLKHKNVPQFIEIFENTEHVFLVMELLKNGNLQQMLRQQRRLSEESTKGIIKQLLEGVAYLHEQKLMHRNICATNIAFRKNENGIDDVCLIGFGQAHLYNTLGNYPNQTFGTPGYIAPEVLFDKPYDYKVDIFSIGIIMYELLNGIHPFYSQDEETTLINNTAGYLDYSNLMLSVVGLTFIKALLEPDSQHRLNANQALAHEWFTQSPQTRFSQLKIAGKIHIRNIFKIHTQTQHVSALPPYGQKTETPTGSPQLSPISHRGTAMIRLCSLSPTDMLKSKQLQQRQMRHSRFFQS